MEDPEPEDSNKEFKFEELTYKDVYDWLESNAKNELNNDINFKYFYDAMKRHTYEYESAALYADMLEKFVRRIKANQDKK